MSSDPHRVLILKPSSLGDIIHALPAVTALRERFPYAHFAWLVKEEWRDILCGYPDVDEVITATFTWASWWRLVGDIRRRRFDLVVDLQGLLRTGMLGWLSGAPRRVGFAAAREGSAWSYTERVVLPLPMAPSWRLVDMHAVDRNLVMAGHLGAATGPVRFHLPRGEAEDVQVETWLADAGVQSTDRVIAIAPTSRSEVKTWPLDRFVRVAEAAVRFDDCKVVLCGSSFDAWMVPAFVSALGNQVVNFVGRTTIRQLVSVLARSAVLVANDSAPVHIAAALGVPVIALWGPTHAGATGPYGNAGHRVLTAPVSCRPCGRRTCRHHVHKECLTAITVEEVMRAMRGLLEAPMSSHAAISVQ